MPSETGLRIDETNTSDDGRNIGIGKPLFEVDDSIALKEKGDNTAEAAAATADEVATVSFGPAVETPAAAGAASRVESSMGEGAERVADAAEFMFLRVAVRQLRLKI